MLRAALFPTLRRAAARRVLGAVLRPGAGTEAAPAMLLCASRRTMAVKPADAAEVIPEVKAGVPGETPSIFDQATGLERAEIDHPDLFKHNEVLRGPFGTEDNPVLIQSNFESRIVGCTGKAAPEDHDLFWINVEKDEKSTCPVCSQVFKLDPL
jgi:uncharacterized Zn-finger protein